MATYDAGFDLWSDPWIGATDLAGNYIQVSLMEALNRAQKLAQLVDASPLVVFGLYRLLAAILAEALPDQNLDDWLERWDAGAFDSTALERLASTCAGRMRLFDDGRPFLQTADVPLRPAGKQAQTIGYLRWELNCATNVTHFDHRGDADHQLCGPCSAKGLVSLTAFCTGKGAGIKAGLTGVPPMYVMPVGANLFQTLLLNHLVGGFHGPSVDSADPGTPWSRSDATVPAKTELLRVGWLESLTWRPRRVRLLDPEAGVCSLCGADGLVVREMEFTQGYSTAREAMWIDPWAAYKPKRKDEAVVIPVRPRADVDTWRDFPALFLSAAAPGILRRPFVLRQLDELVNQGLWDSSAHGRIRYEAFSLRTDMKAKLFEWRRDAFSFSAELSHNVSAAQTVMDCLDRANSVAGALRTALQQLHPTAHRRKPKPKVLAKAMEQAVAASGRCYWAALEARFHALLNDARLVAGDAERNELRETWATAANDGAIRAFNQAADSIVGDGDDLVREAVARATLYRLLPWTKKEETHV